LEWGVWVDGAEETKVPDAVESNLRCFKTPDLNLFHTTLLENGFSLSYWWRCTMAAKKDMLHGIIAAIVLFLVRNQLSEEVIDALFTGPGWRFVQSTVNILSFVGLCFVTYFSVRLIIYVLTSRKS
jgi:hypothetical protein